ncbi:hypothetical protein Lepto7375DRAFT_1833 [Leptolyngbya sp. PCC 7375]|nr:hypothetical protein Lepto7375DRAFT_1833 [Leptolyngbya sp. PCC 7375]
MSSPLPWKIEPKKRKIEADGIEFEIPDYGSLLVGELDYMKAMPKGLADHQFARQFVAFCLRFRYKGQIPQDITDEDLLAEMPVGLIAKLFNFLVYGDENKSIAEVKVKGKKPAGKQTPGNSTGNSSSTTQGIPTLLPKPTRGALSGSSMPPSVTMKRTA